MPNAHSSLDFRITQLLAGISFIAPFAVLPGLYDYADLAQSAWIQVGATALVLIWLAMAVRRGEVNVCRSPLNTPVIALFAWCAASLAWSLNGFEWFHTWGHWAASMLIFFVTLHVVKGLREVTLLGAALLAAGVGVSALGISQYLFNTDWLPQVAPPAATFANRNFAAQFIVLVLPLGLWVLLASRSVYAGWCAALACVLMLTYLVYTGTRAGWLAVASELFFFLSSLAVSRKKWGLAFPGRWKRAPAIAAVAAGTLVLVNLTPVGFDWRGGYLLEHLESGFRELPEPPAPMMAPAGETLPEQAVQHRDQGTKPPLDSRPPTSVAARLAIWRNTLAMVSDHPLVGVGLGNHKVRYPAYSHRVVADPFFSTRQQLEHVHNDYLQVLAELGIVGIGLVAWLVVGAVVSGARIFMREPFTGARPASIAIMTALFGLGINALFSSPLQRSVPPFVVAILIGMLGAMAGRRRVLRFRRADSGAIGPPSHYVPAWIPVAALTVVLILLPAVTYAEYRQLMASAHYQRALMADRLGRPRMAVREGRRAYSLNPYQKKVLLLVGPALNRMQRPAEAINVFNEVLADYPNQINALSNLAWSYAALGNLDRALVVYRQAIKIAPNEALFHADMGELCLLRDDLDGAWRAYNQATLLDPTQARFAFRLGVIANRRRMYRESGKAFERALELRPDWAEAHRNLGVVLYLNLGRKAAGAQHMRRALTVDPGTRGAKDMHALLEQYEREQATIP